MGIIISIFVLLLAFIIIINKYFAVHRRKIIAFIIPIILFAGIYILIKKEYTYFDEAIYDYLALHISTHMTSVMVGVTYMGSSYALIFITLLANIILIPSKKNKRYGVFIAINLFLVWRLNETFKSLFQRERPDILRLIDVTGYSFPSGHSMISMSFYGLILYFLYQKISNRKKKIAVSLFIGTLIFLIGLSRVYLGVHYASDVLAGFLAGYVWLILFITVLKKAIVKK